MKVKRIIDLSQPFPSKDTTNPAFPAVEIKTFLNYKESGWFAEIVTAATHTGTHIDAAAHRIEHGKTIGDYPLVRFQGEAVAIDLHTKNPGEEIRVEDFSTYNDLIKQGDIVLLCTGWGYKKNKQDASSYIYDSPWLGKGAAQYLAGKRINAVGIDHFSIGGARPENVHIPHDILLGADILIFEDMLLPECLLDKERWYVAAFPICLGSVSGSFARIVAIDFEDAANCIRSAW